jgi:hypothetical protein
MRQHVSRLAAGSSSRRCGRASPRPVSAPGRCDVSALEVSAKSGQVYAQNLIDFTLCDVENIRCLADRKFRPESLENIMAGHDSFINQIQEE